MSIQSGRPQALPTHTMRRGQPHAQGPAKAHPRKIALVGVAIMGLHISILAICLHAPPPPLTSTEPLTIHTISAQLISAETVATAAPTQPTALPEQSLPQQTPRPPAKAPSKPLAKPTAAAVLPQHSALAAAATDKASTLAADSSALPAATVPEASATAQPAQAPQPAMLASSAPRTVEHLACAIARPDYPVMSRRIGESGTVLVQITVDAQGGIEAASVNRSSGFARLDEAALHAAQEGRCRPYLENGVPVRARALVPFRFAMDD